MPTSSRMRPFHQTLPVLSVPTNVRNDPAVPGLESVAMTLKSPDTCSLGPEVLIGVL